MRYKLPDQGTYLTWFKINHSKNTVKNSDKRGSERLPVDIGTGQSKKYPPTFTCT